MADRREWDHMGDGTDLLDGSEQDEDYEQLDVDFPDQLEAGERIAAAGMLFSRPRLDERLMEDIIDSLDSCVMEEDDPTYIFGLRQSSRLGAGEDELEVADLEVLGGPNRLYSATVEQMLEAIEQEIVAGDYPVSFADNYREFHEILCDIGDERLAADFLREVIGRGAFPL